MVENPAHLWTVGLILVALLLAGCGGVQGEPTTTVAPPTAVVERAPPTPTATSTPAPTATSTPTPMPEPTPTHTPTPSPVQGVHVVCLNVVQDLPREPITQSVRRILAGLGLQVVDAETACDATLDLDLTYNALGASYKREGSSGSSFCYTGAEIWGKVTLTKPGGEPWELPISAKKAPIQGRIYACPKKEEAIGRIWQQPVLDGLAGLWGPQVYVQALSVPWIEGVRTAAISSLKEIGTEVEGAIPALIRVSWLEEDKLLRSRAVAALAAFGFERMKPEERQDVSSLIQVVEEGENWQRRADAAWALGEMGPDAGEAIPALLQALEDENAWVRMTAAWALGEIGEREGVIPALIEAARDRESWVRVAAVCALGQMGEEESVVPALAQAIGDADLLVREKAIDIMWLVRMRYPRLQVDPANVVPALIAALEDDALTQRRRLNAVSVLRDIGPPAMEAVPVLIAHLRAMEEQGLDEKYAEFDAVLWTLVDITGTGVDFDAASWEAWWKEQQ